jgi:hypothetical protein
MTDTNSGWITCPRCLRKRREEANLMPNVPLESIYDSPLRNQNIRLLQISPGQFNDEVVCNLETFSINTGISWRALSYCWGDPHMRAHIIVNNVRISVTKSLEVALRYMRNPRLDVWVWADAISINQSDGNERSAQVKIMGEIYSEGSFQPLTLLLSF